MKVLEFFPDLGKLASVLRPAFENDGRQQMI